MRSPCFTVVGVLVVFVAGCGRTTEQNEPPVASKPPAGVQQQQWTPIPEYEKYESAEIGPKLEDAVRVLGKWDPVSDIAPEPDGQMKYPFSGRKGYDYLVQVDQNDMVTGVWKRASVRVDIQVED